LLNLANQLIAIRNDFVHYPIAFYFRSADQEAALEFALFPLLRIARQALDEDNPSLRLSAQFVIAAMEDLVALVAHQWLKVPPGAELDVLLQAYADDHLLPSRLHRATKR
jgi:hypothetical protein